MGASGDEAARRRTWPSSCRVVEGASATISTCRAAERRRLSGHRGRDAADHRRRRGLRADRRAARSAGDLPDLKNSSSTSKPASPAKARCRSTARASSSIFVRVGTFPALSISATSQAAERRPLEGRRPWQQLQRLYATAFFALEELEAAPHDGRGGQRRDHRVLGKRRGAVRYQPAC